MEKKLKKKYHFHKCTICIYADFNLFIFSKQHKFYLNDFKNVMCFNHQVKYHILLRIE